MNFKVQVARGAALLDQHRPGWAGYVDIRWLNMGIGRCIKSVPCGCVLAQVDIFHSQKNWGDYDDQINALIVDSGARTRHTFPDRYTFAVRYGFTVDSENLLTHRPDDCWKALTQEWVEAIKERLNG